MTATSKHAGSADQALADRRTLRRALRAGFVTTALLAGLTVAANALFGGDMTSAGIWVATAVVAGLLVSSGWMVLALLADLVAGVVPGRRRVLWTAVLFAAAFVSPVLPAAMLEAAGPG